MLCLPPEAMDQNAELCMRLPTTLYMSSSAAHLMSKLAALHTSRSAQHLMRNSAQLHMRHLTRQALRHSVPLPMRSSAQLLMRHLMLSSAPPPTNKSVLGLPIMATIRKALGMDSRRSAQVFPRSDVPAHLLRSKSRSVQVFPNRTASKSQSRLQSGHPSSPADLYLSRTVP